MSAPSREDELRHALVETTAELTAVIDMAEQLAGAIGPLLALAGAWPVTERRRVSSIATTLQHWSIGARHQAGERARLRVLAEPEPDRSLF